MFKHRKLIVFTVLVMTLILSIGAISAADDTSTSDMDNGNYHTTSESITNENLVSDTQDNNMKQSTPKSIKTDTDNTISINKDNYQEHGWIKEEVEGKYALSYNGEQNPGNVTFIFEDTIDENLNSIALLNTNNTAITANPDVEFNNIAFTLENTNNVTLKDLKINIDENYVYTWIYNPNIIHVDSESTATTIDNVHMNCILPPSTELPHRFNVLDIQSGAEIIDSEFIIETYSSEVDWSQGSEYYGTNQIMPIRTRGESSVNFKNNMIYINATNNNTQFPTLYGITFETPYSIISDNYMEIHGNGWLYAINIKADYCNVTNNEIIVTGTNYTGGIFIQDHSYNLVDNNTITLEADVERVEGADTEPVTYGIVVENYAYTGATYREGTGHVANNTISNNQITCTANNMYAIEQFGGDNTTIINNTMETTGETAMGIGIIGANSIISNNDITVTGTKETGVTVDYLTAKTAGIVTTRGFNARITDNTISSTFSGIYNTGEINDIIEDNIITCTGDYAIKLQSCNYTTVTNNYLVANEEVGDSAVLTNTQTNTIENNLPLPELIETEITITTEIPEEVELYDLLDIEGYFTANGVKCNFDSIEIFDNGGSLEVIESWDSEGGIYYTYDVEEVGEHELSFVFNGNDTHKETESIILFNVYDPNEKKNSFIDFSLDDYVESGEELEISALMYALDDETPISDAVVLIKVIINDEVVHENQTITDEEGWILYSFDTTGLSGLAKVELIFEGNDHYNEIYTSEEIEIIGNKQDVIIMLNVDDEYVEGEDLTVDGTVFTMDDEEAVTGLDITIDVTYSDGTSTSTTVTTDDEGSFTAQLPANVLGEATITASIAENDLYNNTSASETTEIIQKPAANTFLVIAVDSQIHSGDTATITGQLTYFDDNQEEHPLEGAPINIKITIDEAILQTSNSTDSEGMIYYEFDTTGLDGMATIEFTFEGNEYYLESSATDTIEILPSKQDILLVIESDDEYELGTDIELSGILTFAEDDEPVIGETLEVTITYSDGTSLTVESTPTDEEGYFTATLPANVIGQASITASITDNELYNDVTEIITTEIVKTPLETSITVDTDNTIYSGDTLEIDGIILYTDNEDNEYALANAPVILKITIDEAITLETTLTTDNEGMISYQFDTTGIDGNALVELIFEGNEDYMASSDNQEVLIKPARKEVTILLECDESYPDNDDMILSGIAYTADDNELPVTDTLVYITVTFDDDSVETYAPVTDNEGSFIITVSKDKLVVGNVHILASIEESDLYLESTTEAETEITHETFETLLTVDVESTVNSGDIMQIDGILLYSDEVDEYALAGVPVILKITIDDVITLETTITTDNEGMISYQFDTTGITGNAIVELIFEGDYDYRSSSDSSAVEIVKVKKNVVMDCLILDEYAIGEEIVVSGILSVEDEQTPVEGKNVDITIAYYDGSSKTITATTDSDGVFTASFNASVLGTIQVNITSAEDDDYLEAQSELTSYINKIATSLDVNILNTTLGNVTIAVNVYDELDNPLTHGTITVKDAEENLLLTVELDGETSIINVPANAEGQIKIMVEYLENDMYLPSIYINQSALETPDEYFVIIEVKGNYQESVVTLDELTAFVNNTCTISATVTDIDGNDINTGIVEFIDGEGNILGQANVENGVASIEVLYTKELTTQVTATYTSGSEYITDSETTATLTVRKANTIIEIDDVELIAGQTVNLTARVFDEAGNNISVGKVVFKINGKTLKDANGKVLYAKVVNGTATIEYTVPDELAGAEINITATYSGNSKIPGANTTITTTVNTKGASLTLTSPEEVQVGSTATFTATINDNQVVNNGKVVFKINGKTLKDDNGKVIYARIIDNVATIEYTIPESMKAKVYNLTAVLLADEYDRLEAANEIKITN